MNCRNCGAAPNGKARCAYCGTVDFEQVRYLVSCRAEEAEAAMKAIVSLSATGYACVPNGVEIEILSTPTPGQRMTV